MYMKSKEAAELLCISTKQLYRLVESGVLPAYKPSGRILFNRSSLMAYIEDSRVQPKAKPVHITAKRRPTRNIGAVYRGEKKWVGGTAS